MAQPSIEPVTGDSLQEFCAFLHRHLQQSRSVADWEKALRCQWAADTPNFGFMLRADDGSIVGGIGAFYADRSIRGKTERFCNITSWCVLDAYRQQSMRLAMAVIKQPGLHFTDFSPTKVVGNTLKFFKFKELDDRQVVALNMPLLPLARGRVLHRAIDIEEGLTGAALKAYRDHVAFPWLHHLAVGRPGKWCHVIFKRHTFKHLPAARILHLSDSSIFTDHFAAVASFFFWRGILSTHMEHRMLSATPKVSIIRSGFNRKVYLSETLTDQDIDYLYSESVALDL